jgi:ABC-type Mn2+/Zn2+ transport system ATPase subunit
MSVLLELKNLTVKRGAEIVLENLSLNLMPHQITGLTGPNGGGKSSLFETLIGNLAPMSGEMIWSHSVEIAYLAQQLLPRKILPLTVKDFVEMGMWGPKKRSKVVFTVSDILKLLKIESLSGHLISEISGGQWRRALLARCLVQPADLYLLDEPFNQLDLETENRLGHLLKDLTKQHQKTFFIISHDWAAMDHYFDHLLFINKRLLAEGAVRDVSERSMNWSHPEHHQWMHP